MRNHIYDCIYKYNEGVSLVTQMVKYLPAMQETQVPSLGQEDPWRREWLPTLVFLPGEFHGWRRLAGYIHGVAEGWTRLSDFTFPFHFHALEKEMATHSSVLAWRIPGMGEPGRTDRKSVV